MKNLLLCVGRYVNLMRLIKLWSYIMIFLNMHILFHWVMRCILLYRMMIYRKKKMRCLFSMQTAPKNSRICSFRMFIVILKRTRGVRIFSRLASTRPCVCRLPRMRLWMKFVLHGQSWHAMRRCFRVAHCRTAPIGSLGFWTGSQALCLP